MISNWWRCTQPSEDFCKSILSNCCHQPTKSLRSQAKDFQTCILGFLDPLLRSDCQELLRRTLLDIASYKDNSYLCDKMECNRREHFQLQTAQCCNWFWHNLCSQWPFYFQSLLCKCIWGICGLVGSFSRLPCRFFLQTRKWTISWLLPLAISLN